MLADGLVLALINNKKVTCHQVDFNVPTDYRVIIKENNIINISLHLA